MAIAPTPIGGLRRRVETLERDLSYLRRQIALRDKPAALAPQWNLYLAETIAVDAYPTPPANVFGIRFLTPTFTRTEGNQAPTYEEHSADAYDLALSTAGYVPEGTIVFVQRVRSGLYVIVDGGADAFKRLARFTLDAPMSALDQWGEATITDQYGPGNDHSQTTEVHVRNMLTSVTDTYLFSGASGAAGLALWDYGDYWIIIQMQCPPEE